MLGSEKNILSNMPQRPIPLLSKFHSQGRPLWITGGGGRSSYCAFYGPYKTEHFHSSFVCNLTGLVDKVTDFFFALMY
jgi:hypothetical protein